VPERRPPTSAQGKVRFPPAPGAYRIVVEVLWALQVDKLEMVVTGETSVMVTAAVDAAHAGAALKVLTTPDTHPALEHRARPRWAMAERPGNSRRRLPRPPVDGHSAVPGRTAGRAAASAGRRGVSSVATRICGVNPRVLQRPMRPRRPRLTLTARRWPEQVTVDGQSIEGADIRSAAAPHGMLPDRRGLEIVSTHGADGKAPVTSR
jgi:hypothetical protein